MTAVALRLRSGDVLTTLNDIRDNDADRVGGKALNCARLRRAGFPVPDGLVLTADGDPADAAAVIDHPWFSSLTPSTAVFPQASDQTPHPARRFAVRSSGIGEDSDGHSFAGIHETFLDVERTQIADAVRACLRSTTSEQAKAYRDTHGLSGDARTAVLIQPMIDARISGVAFTRHPVTGADELVIDAAPGLGDALVSGRIEPDRYRLRKTDGAVLEQQIVVGRAPLPGVVLQRLADLLVRIEHHFGVPQDVEWAADADALWVLQSRPVTTTLLTPLAPLPTNGQEGTAIAHGVDIEWTRANLAEVIPEQASPQALDAYDDLLNNGQRLFVGALMAPEAELGPPFKAFGGRLYFNLSQLCRVAQIGGASPAAVMRSLGHSEGIRPEDEVVHRPPIGTMIRLLPHLARLAWLDIRAPKLVRDLDADNERTIAKLSTMLASVAAFDDRAIWNLLSTWRDSGPEHMVVILVHGSVMMIEEQLRKALATAGEDYDRFVYAQLAAGEPSVSTRQAFDLVDLADVARSEPAVVDYFQNVAGDRFDDLRSALAGTRFLAAFDRFLDRYGHRGLYESEWALPRYREDPSPLLFALRTHVLTPASESRADRVARLSRTAAEAWSSLDARLSGWQRLVLRPRIALLVQRLKQRYIGREHCRSELVRVLYYARQLHLELADRFVARGWLDRRDDYFLLVSREIGAVIRGSAEASTLRAIVQVRTRERAEQARLVMPLFMRQSDVARVLAGAAPLSAGRSVMPADHASAPGERQAGPTTLTGLCVSRGSVEAEVIVIRDPRDFTRMRRGAILVAPATDPSWTPLFTLAAGVIVEVGGILSHASTVAREYGLPALANVKQATTRLQTGDRVRLNATAGTAELLD